MSKADKINYTFGGYDPNDGLEHGRWVAGRHGVHRWVGRIPDTTPPLACIDCNVPVGPKALRCKSCAQRESRRIKREHMRKVRARQDGRQMAS